MESSEQLEILSQIVNFTVFLYFAVLLIKTDPLNIKNIIISAIGLFSSIIISILRVLEKIKKLN